MGTVLVVPLRRNKSSEDADDEGSDGQPRNLSRLMERQRERCVSSREHVDPAGPAVEYHCRWLRNSWVLVLAESAELVGLGPV